MPAPSDLDAQKRIDRLERRLERERRAREEAETIADRRMRELWLANRELDARVAERTEELEQALAGLEAATAGGAAFLSNLSHEMRTPLNGIVGMLELLGEHAHSDSMRSYVSTALESSERLHRLLMRLLDLVELRAGRLAVSATVTSVASIAELIEQRWRLPALRTQNLLTVRTVGDTAGEIMVDDQRVLQIVGELIDNAIVHAVHGVIDVEIRLDLTPSGGRSLVLTIEDAGPGFDWVQSDDFWAAFAKLDTSANRATEGAGIGLGLASRLAIALDGCLTITRAEGTTATIVVPVTEVTGTPDSIGSTGGRWEAS